MTNYIYGAIIGVLLIIILTLGIYTGIYKSMIANLEKDNKELLTTLSIANSKIDIQNLEIERFKVQEEEAKANYEKELILIEKKYKPLINVSSKNKSCEEILQAINKQQMEFMQ